MSATTIATRSTSSIPKTTVVAGLAAATLTAAAAAGLHAAGTSFEIQGEQIPVMGFAQMTFLGAVIGGIVLAGLNRWSADPGRRFLQATVALTGVSCVPSIALPDHAGSKLALVALHVLAAIIVVPALARHAD